MKCPSRLKGEVPQEGCRRDIMSRQVACPIHANTRVYAPMPQDGNRERPCAKARQQFVSEYLRSMTESHAAREGKAGEET